MTPTQARERASRLAIDDPAQARDVAEAIEDPWFACQALAWVARFAPEDRVEALVSDALRRARSATDEYKMLAAAAWPIRAMVERERGAHLGPVLDDLLFRAASVNPLASRSEALFLLFQAAFPAGPRWWQPVFAALLRASEPAVHWRQRRNLRDALFIVAGEDPATAQQLVSLIQHEKLRLQLSALLDTGKRLSPRPFFWRERSNPGLQRTGSAGR